MKAILGEMMKLALLGVSAIGGGSRALPSQALINPEKQRTAENVPEFQERAVTNLERVDFYGDPLPAEAVVRLGTVRFRHGECINFLRFTPDGNALVTCSLHAVRTWDVATGKQIYALNLENTAEWQRALLAALRRHDASQCLEHELECTTVAKERTRLQTALKRAAHEIQAGAGGSALLARMADLQAQIGSLEERQRILRGHRAPMLEAPNEHRVASTLAALDTAWEPLTPLQQRRVVELLVEQVVFDATSGKAKVALATERAGHTQDAPTPPRHLSTLHSKKLFEPGS